MDNTTTKVLDIVHSELEKRKKSKVPIDEEIADGLINKAIAGIKSTVKRETRAFNPLTASPTIQKII